MAWRTLDRAPASLTARVITGCISTGTVFTRFAAPTD
jgi:hypothetical protein